VNKDGVISNPQDLQVNRVGQNFYGGWTNSISYKSIKLDFQVIFAKQKGQIIPYNGIPGFYNNGISNQPRSILNGTEYPQVYTSSLGSKAGQQVLIFRNSDGQLGDASYLRMRNVSLSWRIKENWTFINLARIYLQCQNVFTITNFKGLDPETARLNTLDVVPPLRVLTAGIQLTL
jgi:hypothetical protein